MLNLSGKIEKISAGKMAKRSGNKFQRSFEELENNAVMWWPETLEAKNADASTLSKLIKSQDDFLDILCLCKKNPLQVFDLITSAGFPSNLFLKHLSILADYGGESIQRLGRGFTEIFDCHENVYFMEFDWHSSSHKYDFEMLPIKGLNSSKLQIDAKGLLKQTALCPLHRDMIVVLLFAGSSTVSSQAALSKCEIGIILGDKNLLMTYVKERYIHVSRIIEGATANALGQLAQQEVVSHLADSLGVGYNVEGNGSIQLSGYQKGALPFDLVVTKAGKSLGIEISFQVTTNSTIERKAREAEHNQQLMHDNGHKVGYVIDGAGNFQRSSAISNICRFSDCTVAFCSDEFEVLAQWAREELS